MKQNILLDEKSYPESLGDLLLPIRLQLVATVLLSVAGSLCMLVAPVAVTLGVGKLLAKDTRGFVIWIAVAVAGIILRLLLHNGSVGYAHLVEADFRLSLRKDFAKKLSRLPLGWFATTPSGEIRKLVSDDIIKIHTIIAHGFSEAAAAITLPLGCAVIMLIYSWKTGLLVMGVIFALLLLGMIWLSMATAKASTINADYEKAQKDMSHAAIEMVDGIKEIKNFGMVDSIFKRFEDALSRFTDTSYKWLGAGSKPMAFTMSALQPAVIGTAALAIGLFSASKGWIKPEGIMLYFLLAITLPSSLITLMQLSIFIRDGANSVKTLLSVFQQKDQTFKVKTIQFVPGDIEFENVSFSYTKDQSVLQNVSCIIPHGKVTALVGPSGGGKTTIARLIARFWDADEGAIKIGGTDVKDFSEQDLLKSVSLVFQDVSLMTESVARNIALARPNAEFEEIEAAAKDALIHERIMRLKDGYDSVIGQDGAVLSGGEKQRLTIARNFLQDAPIVLLDEATAQADAESEMEIQKALMALSANKTVVVIAHRLHTIVGADQILVVDKGKIVQSGTHSELLKNEGVYARLWQAQNSNEGVAV